MEAPLHVKRQFYLTRLICCISRQVAQAFIPCETKAGRTMLVQCTTIIMGYAPAMIAALYRRIAQIVDRQVAHKIMMEPRSRCHTIGTRELCLSAILCTFMLSFCFSSFIHCIRQLMCSQSSWPTHRTWTFSNTGNPTRGLAECAVEKNEKTPLC